MTGARLERQDAGDYRLSGDLTFASIPGLYKRAAPLLAAEGGATIDLTGVARSDSAGLALLVEWLRQARACRQDLHFTHIPHQLAALIHISGLAPVFALTDD